MTVDPRALQWLTSDARYGFFVNAMQFINWERIEGDILEFGVAVGKSLTLMAKLQQDNLKWWGYRDEVCTSRRVIGFESFEGLPGDDQFHPRWSEGSFATNYLADHPVLRYDEPITPQSIYQLFEVYQLPPPEIVVGLFPESLEPSRFSKAALVHIDADLYASAKTALDSVEPILSDGALVCFDDWFMYRGNPNKGEQRAFKEFLEENPHWEAIPYKTYSVFCNSFIMHRRE